MPICAQCSITFEITAEDENFYRIMDVPVPSLCPICRKQRRLAHANMQNLYKRQSDATGETIVSRYSSEKPFPVYENTYWWSDKYDPLEYGRDYDFNKSFLEQFRQLVNSTPRTNLSTVYETVDNSKYINYASALKNCYLVFHTTYCEDCYYCLAVKRCSNVVDCRYTYDSELCYDCTECRQCYELLYSVFCQNCSDSYFLRDCTGCRNCYGCANLTNKRYHIFNKPHSKEDYEDFIRRKNLSSHASLRKARKEAEKFLSTQPARQFHGYQNENVSGNFLYRCKCVKESRHVEDARDCKFCERMYTNCENCYDIDQFGHNAELLYEGTSIGMHVYNIRFSNKIRNNCSNLTYCDYCNSANNCFGCVGLKYNSYCILNKQYSKEEYEDMIPRIIEHMKATGEWGEYFPAEMSKYGYNETEAAEYFPMSKQEVVLKGWNWKDDSGEVTDVSGDNIFEPPDDIKDVSDSITEKTLKCEKTGKLYRIVKQELEFYRKMNIPVPRIHYRDRQKARGEITQ